jgi:MFS superfamily sulfate permease-like transporter
MTNAPGRSRIRSALLSLPGYRNIRGVGCASDLVAGLTLAAYAVPVSVAYASLAGLPPQAGLYCYPGGRSRLRSFWNLPPTGHRPTSAISILIGSAVGTLAAGDTVRHIHLAATVAVLAGFVGIIAWTLRLGTIANFVSETVLSGFKLGAGLVIASTQLPSYSASAAEAAISSPARSEWLRHLRRPIWRAWAWG